MFGAIVVEDRVWTSSSSGKSLRPFMLRTELSPRGKSRRLQRVLTDFGVEHSFGRCSERLREHYGFEIGKSTVRAITLHHAQRVSEQMEQQYAQGYRALPRLGAERIVAQADGTMIATVEPRKVPRRRNRHCPESPCPRPREWKEMRLVAARAQGCTQATYGATFGTVEQAGRRWGHCTRRQGWSLQSRIHIVADGAEWIRLQAQEVFGKQGRLLVDFYHLSQYLAAAAPGCAGSDDARQTKRWLRTQQRRLKRGDLGRVISTLCPCREPDSVDDDHAPVRAAWRYITNRQDHFHYDQALAHNLPIGSGLIESGHKHVLHARLKIQGAAWLHSHAHHIAQLRVSRANGDWNSSWTSSRKSSPLIQLLA